MRRADLERQRFVVKGEAAGVRLDEAIARALSHARGKRLSKSQARKLIVVGAVRVDGRSVRQPGRPLTAAARVEVLIQRRALARAELPADRPFEVTAAAILFEDDALIAVDKPPGLPSQPTVDTSRPSLVSAVKKYLGPGAYLGVHQRLDRDTSGVVLFTKDPRANAELARAMTQQAVVKVYLALTARPRREHPSRWRATGRLGPARGNPPRMRVVRDGGALATTEFHVLRRLSHAWLVEAHPLTGRKHQIRVHLAASGLAILGDALYGGPAQVAGVRVPRAMLHAARLELVHPLTGQGLRIESPIPADFAAALSAAGAAVSGAPTARRR